MKRIALAVIAFFFACGLASACEGYAVQAQAYSYAPVQAVRQVNYQAQVAVAAPVFNKVVVQQSYVPVVQAAQANDYVQVQKQKVVQVQRQKVVQVQADVYQNVAAVQADVYAAPPAVQVQKVKTARFGPFSRSKVKTISR